MASKQSKELTKLYTLIAERISKPDIDLATTRDIVENLHLGTTEPEAVSYVEADADGVPALWCIPEGCAMNRVLLYSHGGGSVVCSMHTDRKAAAHIAKAVGARALVLDYRLSPEHKFPAQFEDVEKAYRWLLAKGIRSGNIASIGQSVGGSLAVGLAVSLRDKGIPLPGAILAVTPWYDMEMRSKTLESNAESDALLSRSLLEKFRESWIGGTDVPMNDPRVNQLYADLSGLPPIMVYYGAHDLLAGEAVEFGRRAKSFGLDVSLHSLPEGQHNFIFGAGRVPEVDQAILEMAQWLRSKLSLAAMHP